MTAPAKPKLFQRWSPAELAIFREVYPAGGIAAVMAATGRSRGSIVWKLQELRLRRSRYWTPEQDAIIRNGYGQVSTAEIARQVGRSENAVGQRAGKLGLEFGRYYSAEEIAIVRDKYPTHTAAAVAAMIGATERRVHNLAKRIGLRKWTDSKHLYEPIRRLHAEGKTDREIAKSLGIKHDKAKEVRSARLKLPTIHDAEAKRQAVRSQLKSLGLTSPTQLRTRAYRRYAVANGWPADMLPREVQILNTLAVDGPQTALEISRRIGMRTDRRNSVHGGAKLLTGCNRMGAEGTYTGSLMKRGLVMRQKRYVSHVKRDGRRGGKQISSVYMLTAAAVSMIEERINRVEPSDQTA